MQVNHIPSKVSHYTPLSVKLAGNTVKLLWISCGLESPSSTQSINKHDDILVYIATVISHDFHLNYSNKDFDKVHVKLDPTCIFFT